jgi:hypothetical protein
MGTHKNTITRLSDAAITTKNLLVKVGSDADHFAIMAAVTDLPLGVCVDTPAAAETPHAIRLLASTDETVEMVAAEAIDAGEEVYAHSNGKVTDLPTDAATYYRVGRALTAAEADGDVLEVEPCYPQAVVVSG